MWGRSHCPLTIWAIIADAWTSDPDLANVQAFPPAFPLLQCQPLCWGFSSVRASWEDVILIWPRFPPTSVFAADHAFLRQRSGSSPTWKASHWGLRPMEQGRASFIESEEKKVLHLSFHSCFLHHLCYGFICTLEHSTKLVLNKQVLILMVIQVSYAFAFKCRFPPELEFGVSLVCHITLSILRPPLSLPA